MTNVNAMTHDMYFLASQANLLETHPTYLVVT